MKLILINGPCGIGKSTLSAKIHANAPLSFLLDIDAQRRYISNYHEQKRESSAMIQDISCAIIKSCLENKHDVIVDKMIFDSDLLDQFYKIANSCEAEVCEIIIWAPKDVVMKRAHERGFRELGLLTPEKCELFWDKIDELKNIRPQAKVIDINNMTEEEVYSKISAVI